MAALNDADFTSLAEANDIIPTEHIQATVEGFNLPINIGNLLVMAVPGMGYTAHQFARWDNPTFPNPVRAGGETDTVLRMEMSTSSSSITPVLKGVQLVIQDELVESPARQILPGQGVPLGMLYHLMRKVQEYIDEDILDTAQAATNTVGSAVTVPSFAQFRTCVHAYKLLENDGQLVGVFNHYFWERLTDEFATANSALANRLLEDPRVLSGQKSAYRGQLMGVDMFESGNVATEGGGANNFLTVVGGGANRVIGYVNQRSVRVEVSRGDDMQSRQSTQYTCTWADGVGLLRPDGLLECLMDAAA